MSNNLFNIALDNVFAACCQVGNKNKLPVHAALNLIKHGKQ